MSSSVSALYQDLSNPSLRKGLEQMIRARVPSSEVDDLVQATLTDALASTSVPSESEEVRRWVFGIARHKIADFYRRSRRERPGSLPEIPVSGAKDLMQWAEKELAENSQSEETLDWMLREGDGDKLEKIAQEDQVPAPRVRQRVNRMRKFLRERWAAELAAVAALAVVIGALWYAWRQRPQNEVVVVGPDHSAVRPVDSALLRAAELRSRALQDCEKKQWQACVDGLDEAAKLDPTGERSDEVVKARQGAAEALSPPQAPAPAPSSSSKTFPGPTKNLSPVPTETPPGPPMKMAPKANEKTAPDTKKGPPTKDSKDPSDSNFNVAPGPTSNSTPNSVDTTPTPQPTVLPQQQAPQKSEDTQMQQKAPKKTKGGKPTYGTKEGGYDVGSGK